jgi:hypothetical protein
LVDRLKSPAFATSVGLLQWALTMQAQELTPGKARKPRRGKGDGLMNLNTLKAMLKRLLP